MVVQFGAVAVKMARTVYVAHNGSDSNSGLTSATPLATLNEAALRLGAVGGGSVYVDAPSGTPLTTIFFYQGAHDIDISGLDGATWYMNVTANSCVLARSLGTITLTGGDFTSDSSAVVVGGTGDPAGYGKVVAANCRAEGATNGWRTLSNWTSLVATDCTGLGGTNDGWNINGAGTATLTDCIGDDCGDEGVSPHQTATLNIVGGHYNRNGEAGMAAVDSAVCNISGGAVFDSNGQTSGIYGGLFYFGASSGVINGAALSNNVGPGIDLDTSGTVTLTAYTSTGNGAADDIT